MFEACVGKDVKIVFNECNGELRILKGKLLDASEKFLKLSRFSGQVVYLNTEKVTLLKEIFYGNDNEKAEEKENGKSESNK